MSLRCNRISNQGINTNKAGRYRKTSVGWEIGGKFMVSAKRSLIPVESRKNLNVLTGL